MPCAAPATRPCRDGTTRPRFEELKASDVGPEFLTGELKGHLRKQKMSLRAITGRIVITTRKKGQHPSPATVMRMLREHDEQTAGR